MHSQTCEEKESELWSSLKAALRAKHYCINFRPIEKENVHPVEISKVLIENWPQPEINEEILRPLGRKKKGVKLRDAEVLA